MTLGAIAVPNFAVWSAAASFEADLVTLEVEDGLVGDFFGMRCFTTAIIVKMYRAVRISAL